MKNFSNEQLDKLMSETFEEAMRLRRLKGVEYAGDSDALSNFKKNGAALGVTPETVWAVYAGKHWDAIQQYVQDLQAGKSRERLESILGRADDLIVYLVLFKAIYEARQATAEGGQAIGCSHRITETYDSGTICVDCGAHLATPSELQRKKATYGGMAYRKFEAPIV